ncbi:MAG: YebC/PmpR family DNA-binding transcriptional regulator [Gammaproteobacteria bacterium]|nr:YebC/PmpR family DNA-binding transcriptional regulator [Gammaproteobacteria bacterium]
MAGHSKWANIQHRKGRQDSRRGKLFSKLIREITVAARSGGGPDPASNPRLRAAIDAAATANMSKDTIERAIKRAAGPGEGANLEEIRYEGYGPGGVAVMVDCMSDNRNRTVAELRHAFSKCGGNLGTGGSVAYLFTKAGSLSFPAGTDEDRLLELALDAGAEDVVSSEDGSFEVVTAPDALVEIKERLIGSGLSPESTEVTMRASTNQKLGRDHAESMVRLLEMLEELDDVQKVYSNADIPNEILEQIAG